ncbi:MAG: glycosyltransferase family 1 protein [bacterium]|nr:glycosyltransferase family 1 protein [bacterium]
MTKIAYITNAPPQAGMGKPAREIYSRINPPLSPPLNNGGYVADFFYLDASKRELLKNDVKIAEVSNLPKPLQLKPIQWWRLARQLPTEGYDLWHITNQTLSFIPRQDFLLTVYDLIELLEPQEKFGKYVAQYLYKGIPKAKHIICISEYTKKMLQQAYAVPDEKITIIPLGVGEHFKPIEGVRESIAYHELLAQNNLPKDAKIILYVGSDHPRKNLNLLAGVLTKVKARVPNAYLVKVGDPGLMAGRIDFQDKLAELGLTDAVRFISNVGDEKLRLLYASADVFVFPSFYEGFGIPPLEAMACGTPVVCSNATSLPEVVGDAGLLHDPTDVEGFATSITRILTDTNYSAELSRKGLERSKMFSWEGIAQKTAEVYRRMTASI